MPTLKYLLSAHAGLSYARQLAFADYLGEHTWQTELRKGTVDFGAGRCFPIQVIGTESYGDNTWMWAWANSQSDLPDSVLGAAQLSLQYGEQHEVPELTTSTLPLAVANGHALCMVSGAITEGYCYYRGPYTGGAIYFLVMEPFEFEPVSSQVAVRVINEVIGQFDVVHRLMATEFLQHQGFDTMSSDGTLTATRAGRERIVIQFDDADRIQKLNACL